MADLIERQSVLDSFKRICNNYCEDKEHGLAICRSCYLDDAIDIVENLPSAQPDVPDINVGDMVSKQETETTKGEIMEQDNKVLVSIPLYEYRDLLTRSVHYETMKGILFQNARLNYDDKDLRFDCECLNDFLRMNDGRFNVILEQLQKEKKLKESEDHKNE